MATTEETITAAMLAGVASLVLSPALPIAWPNFAFAPPTATGGKPAPYLRVNTLPAPTAPLSLAHDGSNTYTGLMQIDVLWPEGVGLAAPMAVVGAILVHFARGTRLDRDGLRIDVTQSYSSAALREEPRLMVPVTISYRAFAPNP